MHYKISITIVLLCENKRRTCITSTSYYAMWNAHAHIQIPSGQWIHCNEIKIYQHYQHHQMVLNRNRSDPMCVCEQWVRGCRSLNKWLMTDFGFCGVPTMFDQKTVVSGLFAIIIMNTLSSLFGRCAVFTIKYLSENVETRWVERGIQLNIWIFDISI